MPNPIVSTVPNPQSPNVNFKGPIENGRLTYKQNNEKTVNNSLDDLLQSFEEGDPTEKLKEKYNHLGFPDQAFNDLQSVKIAYNQDNRAIAATAAFINPNISLLPVAKRDMQQNFLQERKDKPEDPTTNHDNATTIPDKVARIITLMEDIQNTYNETVSKEQLANIRTGLITGKLQLNQIEGWDGAANALVDVIESLRNNTNLSWDDNCLLKGPLDWDGAVNDLGNVVGVLSNETNLLYDNNCLLKDQLDTGKANCLALITKIGDLTQVNNPEEHQKLIDQISQLGTKVLALHGDLKKDLDNIRKSNGDIEGLQLIIDDHKHAISDLKLEKAELERQLALAQDIDDPETIKTLKVEITGLHNKITPLDEDIIDLQDKIREKTVENKKLTDDIDILDRKLSDTLNKKERSDKHTVELIAGIVALVASTTLLLVALLPKDDSSEETINNTVDTSDLKSELQNQATELEGQIAQDDTTIAKLDYVQATLADISDAIEGQEDTLVQQENDKIKEAGDEAYQQALAEAEAAAYKDPANQAFDVNEDGVIVPTGKLTPEAQDACYAQADSAREAAEAQAKQNIDALLEEAGQLDSQIQTAGRNAAEMAQKIASDRIATQTQLDQINSLISQIPDEVSYKTQNIEITNNGLSEAGFVTTLTTAAVLAAGGTGLLVKYGLNFRKRKDNVEITDAKIVNANVEDANVGVVPEMLEASQDTLSPSSFMENNLDNKKVF